MFRGTLLELLAALSLLKHARAQPANTEEDIGIYNSTTPSLMQDGITVHTINVTNHGFRPNSVLALEGDKIMFVFFDGNHSVIQSLYRWPCQPKGTVDGVEGFASAFFPIMDTSSETPSWNLTIVSTDPTFFYCGAPGECFNKGMVGGINLNNDTNLTAQIAMAKASRYALLVGDAMPAPAAASLSVLAGELMGETNAPTSHETAIPSTTLSGGAIAGIVIGAVVLLATMAGFVYYFGRNRFQALRDDSKLSSEEVPLASLER